MDLDVNTQKMEVRKSNPEIGQSYSACVILENFQITADSPNPLIAST
jgi:hypothetical protein